MKLFFKSYFLLNFFILSLQVHATPSPKEPAQAVWKLQNDDGNGGTGFFIAPNLIVTNFHVIAGLLNTIDTLENINLLQKANQVSSIKITKILALSITYDLAILETNKHSKSYLNITTDPVNETQDLFALGYPHGKFSKTSKIGPLQTLTSKLIFPVNKSGVMGGSSGSPVLNTKNQVVGIVYGGVFNLMNATRAKQLNRLIKKSIGFDCTTLKTEVCITKTYDASFEKAEQGDVEAQYVLGKLYLGQPETSVPAFKWIQRGAKLGHPMIQDYLGSLYLFGKGVKQDKTKAFYWTQKAAKQGYLLAQYNLSVMYFKGNGVKQDNTQFVFWLQKAAEKGLTIAQYNLGNIYISLEK